MAEGNLHLSTDRVADMIEPSRLEVFKYGFGQGSPAIWMPADPEPWSSVAQGIADLVT